MQRPGGYRVRGQGRRDGSPALRTGPGREWAVRTRYFDSLRNREIEEYLTRSDIIFLPVGTMEMHGEMPVGCEHVRPIAFCQRVITVNSLSVSSSRVNCEASFPARGMSLDEMPT